MAEKNSQPPHSDNAEENKAVHSEMRQEELSDNESEFLIAEEVLNKFDDSVTPQETSDEEVDNCSQDQEEGHLKNDDMKYISDLNAAVMIRRPVGARFITYAIVVIFAALIAWASWAPLHQLTRGVGKVIPSSSIQILQNLEGGIIEEILVSEGQRVRANEAVVKLSDEIYRASYRESAIEYYSELARISRLKAQLYGNELVFPEKLNGYKDYVTRETFLYQKSTSTLAVQIDIIDSQIVQFKHELELSRSKLEFLEESYKIEKEMYDTISPLTSSGSASKIDYLEKKQQLNDLESQKTLTALGIPKLEAALQETIARREEASLQYSKKTAHELKESEVRLHQIIEFLDGLKNKINRTTVRTPVDGIVNVVHIGTVGGVVAPGMDLVEVVPTEDSLLVEARIYPKDIGFIKTGMKVIVKFTAYDFTIHGGLDGVLEFISPDTSTDEKNVEYYTIKIKTHKNYIGTPEKPLYIIPGMEANVDIITGKKTLLEYFLKPLLKARQNALTEA